jgi:hypothetical protein
MTADHRSDRIDTVVTLVEVDSGSYRSPVTEKATAIDFVCRDFPGTEVLGVWRHPERGDHGSPVWAVEHVPEPTGEGF